MGNIYRGEVTITVAGKTYCLRPTFHILCQIEQRVGLTVPQLLQRIADKGLLASEILMILSLASQHDGSPKFDSAAMMDMPADAVRLHDTIPALAECFLQALGRNISALSSVPCCFAQNTEATAKNNTASEARLDYMALLELAYKVLRLEPAQFWQLTMAELRVLLRAVRPKTMPRIYPHPEEINALLHRYPDAISQTSNAAY
ncbi:MAG: phage tail assembly chaperone [Alphaproteobacteria bacterium]|nr:phage tail assembly chaperone [Alphaproteobacteria bacterium]